MAKNKRRYSTVVALPDGFRVDKTKNKGIPQLVIDLQIVDADDKTRIGDKVTKWQVVNLDNDDSVKWAVEAMRALGMSNTNIFKPEGLGRVKATLCEEYEVYEGSGRWKAKFINEIKERKSISGDMADEFGAALEAAFASVEPLKETSANAVPDELPSATDFPPPRTVEQFEDDDDIFA